MRYGFARLSFALLLLTFPFVGAVSATPPASCEYEVRVTIDPTRSLLKGEGLYRFRYPEEAREGGLYLDPCFQLVNTSIADTVLTRTNRLDPIRGWAWEGWPYETIPSHTQITYVSQDYLLLGPLMYWLPGVLEREMASWGKVSISCPAQYTVVTDGILQAEEEKFGFRKSTFSFGGLGGRPRVLVLSRYPMAERAYRERSLRILANPRRQVHAVSMLERTARILAVYELWFGPFRFPSLTLVEAPPVFRRDFLLGSHVAGLGLKGVVLLATDEFEGKLDERLLSHELAHQWWGSLVGGSYQEKSGSLWLIEGLAEYASMLYAAHEHGDAARRDRLAEWAAMTRLIVEEHGDRCLRDLSREKGIDARNGLAYTKGPYVLHMIELKVGRERFLQVLQQFLKQWNGGRPTADDFRKILESETALDWHPFFDQWIYRKGVPDIAVRYSASRRPDATWGVRIQVAQEKPFFNLAVPIRIYVGVEAVDVVVATSDRIVTTEMVTLLEPTTIEVDPEGHLLLGEVDLARVAPIELE